MATSSKSCRKKKAKHRARADKAPTLSVVTLRVSDAEKERIDDIMQRLDIPRYSDVMRMALQLVKRQTESGNIQAGSL